MSHPVVYLVDDDDAIRSALADLLQSAGHVVRAYPCAAAFLGGLREKPHGCAILDIRMPGMSGLDLQRLLAASDVDLPLIFLTGHADIPMCVQAMSDGASDFLTKPFREQDVIDAVGKAMRLDAQSRADNERRKWLAAAYAALSTREKFIMAAAAGGRLNKVIAAELGLSEITVKLSRAKMMRKMGARSIAELAVIHHRLEMGKQSPNATLLSFERTGALANNLD